jgi:hypothetical protein
MNKPFPGYPGQTNEPNPYPPDSYAAYAWDLDRWDAAEAAAVAKREEENDQPESEC